MKSTDQEESYRIIGNVKKYVDSSMTKAMYGWSKYGDSNLGLVQKNKTEEWHCCACGELLGSSMPTYMFEICKDEFIRICSLCQFLKLVKHLKALDELLKAVRKHHEVWDSWEE